MQVSRPRLATLALLSVCAASGCRAAGVGNLARPDPPLTPTTTAGAAEILAEHNRNAGRIQSVMARTDLTITVYDPNNKPSSHPLSGRLAMEQPRNFKLVLSHTGLGDVGDIGSNDTEYWFWIKDKTQKAIYYCNYDDAELNRQAATFQPDWIKEAMGLRVIPDAEAAQITVRHGEPGTLILTHRPQRSGGETYTRVTLIDKATHRILEHQLRSGDQKRLLARAEVPEGYTSYLVPADAGSGDASVFLPKRLKLSWIQEGLKLDVTFRDRDVRINGTIKQALFVEPQGNFTRINLAERPPGTATAGPTTIRETRPAPPSGIRLREPAPIEGEDAAQRDDRGRFPLALGGEEPAIRSLTEEVVGQRFPTAAEPDYLKPENSGWRAATSRGPQPE